jgi:transposase
MVTSLSPKSIEERRRQAAKLFAAGFTQAEVAQRCGVTRQSAMRWARAFEQGGVDALEPKQRGRPRKLTDAQHSELHTALLEGPSAHGWSTELWTLDRIATLVRRRFGIRYHRSHVSRLMRTLGWSLQRPTTRAKERDEESILRWKSSDWPGLKKKGARTRPTSSSTKAASPKGR